ncbi:MAG TPA: AI-2E family transporter [Anaerolineales bacterium]|nr:AI-2E family transporter [Anaerolineales bacterium]
MSSDTQWSRSFRYSVGVISFLALVAFMFYAHDAVRNLVIAAFIAYLIDPAVVYLTVRTRLSRFAAVNIVYFTALILLLGLPASLTPIFYEEARNVIQDLLALSTQVGNTLSQPVQFGGLVFHLEAWGQYLLQLQDAVLAPLPEEALHLLETTSVSVLWFLIIIVSVYLILSEWPRMRDRMFTSFPPEYHPELQELYARIRRIWMAYLRGQIVLMVIVGVVFTIVWSFMGIPGALVLGVLAGLFTLVPDVGPFVAVTIAAGVALLEGSRWGPLAGLPNFWVAGIVIGTYLILINLKNFFLRPIIMGRSVHMHEGLVFVAILVATILEGILGALLVVPVLASAVVIAGYIQRKLLGLPPFEDDGSQQFVAPPEALQHRRKWTSKERQEYLNAQAPNSPEPAASSETITQTRPGPARKKTRQ